MAGASIISYKGKEILFTDFKGTKSEKEMIDILEKGAQILLKKGNPMLLLTDLTGAYVLPDFMKKAKELGKSTKSLTLKEAIVGIKGPKKTLLNLYNIFTGIAAKAFNTEEEAKEYLTRD
jgi:hypothetical protein